MTTMLTRHLPGLIGGRHLESPIAPQGHDVLYWPLMLVLGAGVTAAAISMGRRAWWTMAVDARGAAHPTDFPIYLLGVGMVAVLGYVITRPPDSFLDRYMLLALYLPVGAAATTFAIRSAPAVRAIVAVSILLLATGSAIDHARQVARYWGGRQPNDLRVLADGLVSRGVRVASAGYWRAYKLTFLTGERVKIAANDYLRIEEYQRLADAEGDNLITIQEEPCAGGETIAGWYLCRSPR
jgi:hypothetical protein